MNDEVMNCWSLRDGRYIHRAMETRMKSNAIDYVHVWHATSEKGLDCKRKLSSLKLYGMYAENDGVRAYCPWY